MELQAVTGQLFVVDGTAQETTEVPGVVALSAPGRSTRGRSSDLLFIHLTLSGQLVETAVLAQDLIDSLSSVFYRTSGSITAALRKAIVETNKLLLGHNLDGATKTREGAVTCAVLRGDELFMAQAGESFALMGHSFGLERLPATRPERIVPLGRTAGLDIRYFHHWLQPDNMLLLADPRMWHLPTDGLHAALQADDVESGLQILSGAVGKDTVRLMLIEFTDEAPASVPDATVPVRRAKTGQRLSPPTGVPVRDVPYATQADAIPSAGSLNVETVETTARKATAEAARGLSRLTGWLANLLETIRPASMPGQNDTWTLPAILAIVIPVLIAAIVTGVYFQRGQVVQYGELRREMEQSLAVGRQLRQDPAAASLEFQRVLELGADADLLRPGDAEVGRLRTEAMAELDGIGGVARLTARLLHEYESSVQLTSVAIGDELNGDIYVLDSTNNRVTRLETDESFENLLSTEPATILFNEQVVGNHVVGGIIDIMWRPRGADVTRDGLAMLDSRGALVTYYPNFGDTRAVPLGLASDWRQPKAVAAFSERLYILDTAAQQIWRYFSDGDGFTLSSEQRSIEFVNDPGLGQVVDVSIYSEDGSVLLLYRDGRLRRYVRGRLLWSEADLAGNGLEEPLVAPTAAKIVGRGLNSSIFVADPATHRIVQLSLGGTYLAQFKALDVAGKELFSQAVDFAVAENPLRIFVTAGNRLYVATQS